jgi:hypothetical protein
MSTSGSDGRSGRCGGRAIVFYGDDEKTLVDAIRAAERDYKTSGGEGSVGGRLMETNVPEVEDVVDENGNEIVRKTGDGRGSVEGAFSRKRGFKKKEKKIKRAARQQNEQNE